jgi:hypothetical protein
MKKFALPLILLAVVAGLVAVFIFGNNSNSKSADNASPSPAATLVANPSSLPGLLTGDSPWPANTDQLAARLGAMGLQKLPSEGTVLHIHQHLDIYVNGQKVTVPAFIGIAKDQSFISDLHTHDASGVMHVESPVQATFYLGQFFDVWGVKFTANQIGGYQTSSDKQLTVYVNGTKYQGDPRAIKLAAHQEIVVVYGSPSDTPATIPSNYAFPSGE